MSSTNLIIQNILSIVYFDLIKSKKNTKPFLLSGSGSGWNGILYKKNILDLGQRFFELSFENNKKKSLSNYSQNLNHRNFHSKFKSAAGYIEFS